jgi:hypothetical protein
MNSTATELEFTGRRAMRGIVKGFVVGTLGLIQKGELRRGKSIVFTIALTTVAFVAGEASAAKLTEQQVKNVCAGQKIQESSLGWGCQKKCGDKICDYTCEKDKNGKSFNCSGEVVTVRRPSTPPIQVKPPAGTLQKKP